MRCRPLAAALVAALLCSVAASAADKATPIDLSTVAGTEVAGTIPFATIKVTCDLRDIEVPTAKVDRISSANHDSH
jgi:hypothetical protein